MKVAYIQQNFPGSKSEAIKKTTKDIQKVASKGAELVVLQELHQNYYFCTNKNEKNFYLAKSFNKDVEYWSNVARDNGVVLVTSLFEKRAPGVYNNTAVVFEKDGEIAGIYRKMHIPSSSDLYEKYYFTPGDLGYKPIKTSVGNLGVMISWDQWFPEAARIMSLSGADILIYTSAVGVFDKVTEREGKRQLNAWKNIQLSHAIANTVPVISVNRIGREDNKNSLLKSMTFWGSSFVCDSFGGVLHESPKDEEDTPIIELDLEEKERTRFNWPFYKDRRIRTYKKVLKMWNN